MDRTSAGTWERKVSRRLEEVDRKMRRRMGL
jgi:hypothetical protein